MKRLILSALVIAGCTNTDEETILRAEPLLLETRVVTLSGFLPDAGSAVDVDIRVDGVLATEASGIWSHDVLFSGDSVTISIAVLHDDHEESVQEYTLSRSK